MNKLPKSTDRFLISVSFSYNRHWYNEKERLGSWYMNWEKALVDWLPKFAKEYRDASIVERREKAEHFLYLLTEHLRAIDKANDSSYWLPILDITSHLEDMARGAKGDWAEQKLSRKKLTAGQRARRIYAIFGYHILLENGYSDFKSKTKARNFLLEEMKKHGVGLSDQILVKEYFDYSVEDHRDQEAIDFLLNGHWYGTGERETHLENVVKCVHGNNIWTCPTTEGEGCAEKKASAEALIQSFFQREDIQHELLS